MELKVTLNDKMTDRLRDIAAARGVSPTEVLERAVALYGYALEKADPQGPKLKVTEGGQTREIEL